MGYSPGGIKVNHEGMATCITKLQSSAAVLTDVKDKVSSQSTTMIEGWQGSSGSAFKVVSTDLLALLQEGADRLGQIAQSLSLTDQAFEAVDTADAQAFDREGS